jgi:hypothetical protein
VSLGEIGMEAARISHPYNAHLPGHILGATRNSGVKPSLVIRPRLMDGITTVDYDFGLADEQESTQA